MRALLPWLLAAAVPCVHAQDGVAVISSAVVLFLISLCVGMCCCAGVGVYTICNGGVRDYDRSEDPDDRK